MPSIELSPISSTTSQTRPQPGSEGAGTKYVPLQQINVSESEKDQTHDAPKKQSFQSKVNEKWVIEIACCVGMLAALASVIGFLAAYDGRSIPDWPYGITVNTVLSLITLVLNACLTGVVAICVSQWKWISFHSQHRPLAEMNTYDWASRGAWGCFMFLFNSNIGQYTTIGALAMILAAGNGPFVQQMVKVENNRISSDGVATLARAQSYSYTPSPSSTGNEPPVGMIGSIYASVFSCLDSDCSLNSSDASYSTVLPSCPSGECDFPRFTTLAVCSSCTDITNHLSHSTDSCNGQFEQLTTDLGLNSPSLFTYSLPSGLNTSFVNDVHNSTYLKTTTETSASKMRSIAKLPSYGNTTITDFTAIKSRITRPGAAPEVNATQCSLYWCTKSITARMTGNVLEENHVETHTEASAKYEIALVRIPAPKNESSITGQSESYFSVNAVTGFVKLQQEPSSTTWLDKKLEFDNLGKVTCNNRDGNNTSVTDFTEPMSFYPVERLFENIAAGMTISVRRSGKSSQQDMVALASVGADSVGFGEGYKIGSAYNVPLDEGLGVVNGTSYRLETQIEVRWAWVTFPAALVLLAGGFLVITIFKTRGSGVPLIKSSCIPLLSSGLDGETQESLRMLNDPVAKDDASSAVMVQFIKDDQDSWRMDAIPR